MPGAPRATCPRMCSPPAGRGEGPPTPGPHLIRGRHRASCRACLPFLRQLYPPDEPVPHRGIQPATAPAIHAVPLAAPVRVGVPFYSSALVPPLPASHAHLIDLDHDPGVRKPPQNAV